MTEKERKDLAMRMTDAVVEVMEDMLASPCPGRRICTAHRAVLMWTISDIIGGIDGGGNPEAGASVG